MCAVVCVCISGLDGLCRNCVENMVHCLCRHLATNVTNKILKLS